VVTKEYLLLLEIIGDFIPNVILNILNVYFHKCWPDSEVLEDSAILTGVPLDKAESMFEIFKNEMFYSGRMVNWKSKAQKVIFSCWTNSAALENTLKRKYIYPLPQWKWTSKCILSPCFRQFPDRMGPWEDCQMNSNPYSDSMRHGSNICLPPLLTFD
jgi:hypothetical protein